MVERSRAAIDGEELAFIRDEEAGWDGDGNPKVDDGGMKSVEEFDGFGCGHLGKEG